MHDVLVVAIQSPPIAVDHHRRIDDVFFPSRQKAKIGNERAGLVVRTKTGDVQYVDPTVWSIHLERPSHEFLPDLCRRLVDSLANCRIEFAGIEFLARLDANSLE